MRGTAFELALEGERRAGRAERAGHGLMLRGRMRWQALFLAIASAYAENPGMALLRILHYPDPRLRRHAEPVGTVDDGIRRLIDDMFETMYDAPGIGLAAPQVDVSKRVVTIDLSKDRSGPLCLVDPEIQWTDGEMEVDEGCLSVPDVFDVVKRAGRIRVTAADRDGRSREIEAEGLLAACIQHEIDHLDGRLFVDHLSRLKRQRIRKRAEKLLRHA